jgi:RimJ/RimL family protein N-acetyltransferase
MPPIVIPDPPLSDGVVTLRPFSEDDIPALLVALRDPEISRWTATIPYPYEEHHAREFIGTHDEMRASGRGANYVITDAGDGRILGAVGMEVEGHGGSGADAEVGYWVAAVERGRGVATRAVGLIVEWMRRDLGIGEIALHTFPGNVASERVAEKSGFVPAGRHSIERCGRDQPVNRWLSRP